MDGSNLTGYRLIKEARLPIRRELSRLPIFGNGNAITTGGAKPALNKGDGSLILLAGACYLVLLRGSVSCQDGARTVHLRGVVADDLRSTAGPRTVVRAAQRPVEFSAWSVVTVPAGSRPVPLSVFAQVADDGNAPFFSDEATLTFADAELIAVSFTHVKE